MLIREIKEEWEALYSIDIEQYSSKMNIQASEWLILLSWPTKEITKRLFWDLKQDYDIAYHNEERHDDEYIMSCYLNLPLNQFMQCIEIEMKKR